MISLPVSPPFLTECIWLVDGRSFQSGTHLCQVWFLPFFAVLSPDFSILLSRYIWSFWRVQCNYLLQYSGMVNLQPNYKDGFMVVCMCIVVNML